MNKIIAKDCKYRTYDKYLGVCCLKGLANDTDDLDQCDFCNTNWEEQILENYQRSTKVNNNFIKLKGKIIEQDCYKTFETHGETFVELKLEVKRKSEVADLLPITMSLSQFNSTGGNKFLEIVGEIRTRNFVENGKSRLIITVFAKEVKVLEREEYENSVELNGYICKQPVLRKTALTNLDIADCLIATNNNYGKSYYIPTISFNRDATFVSSLPVGTEISVQGRMQSRCYSKKLSDTESIEKIAIELCVKQISKIEKGV